jgi:hypothetical protein
MRLQGINSLRIRQQHGTEYGVCPVQADTYRTTSTNPDAGSRARIMKRRATLARPTNPGTELLETEVLWIVHTVALAILNPRECSNLARQIMNCSTMKS